MSKIEKADYYEMRRRIEELEEKTKSKDIWDIISVISSFLIPLSIFVGTMVISRADQRQQQELARIESERQAELARIEQGIDQAQLIAAFLEPLVAPDSQRQRVAIESIQLALPKKGKEFIDRIRRRHIGGALEQYIEESLGFSELIESFNLQIDKLYADDPERQLAGKNEILNEWFVSTAAENYPDPDEYFSDLITALMDYLDYYTDYYFGDEEVAQGLVNTLSIFKSLDDPIFDDFAENIYHFAQMVREDYDSEHEQINLLYQQIKERSGN
ncbi:MAG: hypothetical protein AAFY36_03025 [Bacteroidota bacterium]